MCKKLNVAICVHCIHLSTLDVIYYCSSVIVFADHPAEDLEPFLHGREAAVLIVTMVDAGVTIAAQLYVEAFSLKVAH